MNDWLTIWTPAAVGGLVTIIGGAIVAVLGAWKIAKIEAHVNSEKTQMTEKALAKDQEILLLREMIAERKLTAALLAQAATNRTRDMAAALPTGPLDVTVVNAADAPVPTEVVNPPSVPVPTVVVTAKE